MSIAPNEKAMLGFLLGMVYAVALYILTEPPKPPVVGLTVPCTAYEGKVQRDVVLSELRAIEGLAEAPAN